MKPNRRWLKYSLLTLPVLALVFHWQRGASASAKGCEPVVEIYAQDGFEVEVRKFVPAGGSEKAVLVMPPTGGANRIDLSYGRSICAKDMIALVPTRWTDDDEYSLELAIHDRLYRRAQLAIDLMVRNTSARKVGILGTSLGATHAAIASMRNDRVDSIFLIVGGAPISAILVNSEQQVLAEGKAKRFGMFGYRSLEEYETALKKVIPFEPLAMKPVRGLPKLGMVYSSTDVIVPARYQENLREAWRPRLAIESSLGHLGTIVKTWLCDADRVTGFFAETLAK